MKDRESSYKGLVIVPAFNEENNIGDVLADLADNKIDLDVLVVDDGSRDGTISVLKGLGANYLSHPVNLGYGASLQTGYRYAIEGGYDLVIQFDGDCQHRADQIPLLLKAYENGEADIIIGSRYFGAGVVQTTTMRVIAHKLFGLLIKTRGGLKIKDITSGFQLLDKRAYSYFARYDGFPMDHPDANLILLSIKLGFRLKEVPVLMRDRKSGAGMFSKWRIFFYMIEMTINIFVIRLRYWLQRSGGESRGL